MKKDDRGLNPGHLFQGEKNYDDYEPCKLN